MSAPSKTLPANQVEFEEDIFQEFARTYGDVGRQALAQFRVTETVERTGSGTGFFSDYSVPSEFKSNILSTKNEAFGEIAIREADNAVPLDSLTEPYSRVGYFIRWSDGFIYQLECFNFGGSLWPIDRYDWRLVPGGLERRSLNG
jgi:hypothetical protein